MRIAIRLKFAFLGCAALGARVLQSSSLRAADPSASQSAAPSAYVVVTGANELMDDVKYILMLTDTNEQKQWKVLKDYLEVFLIGVDPKLPTRVDIAFDEKGNRQVWTVAISNFW